MGVGKGEPWEQPLPPGVDITQADDDAAAAAAVAAAMRDGVGPPTLHISSGDVARSLGGGGVEHLRCPMDAMDVRIDTDDGTASHLAVAHVVVRAPLWAGDVGIVMNVSHLGEWNLGPKAHPGDGLLDVTEGRLGLRDRLAARSRARLGTHVPHPALRTRRVADVELPVARTARVIVDGVAVARGSASVRVSVRPDAWWWVGHLPA